MKKLYTKVLSILCVVCLFSSVVSPAFAAQAYVAGPQSVTPYVIGPQTYPVSFGSEEAAALDEFNSMTTAQLNTYITNLANGVQPASLSGMESTYSILSPAVLGWLAAAVILFKLALPCTFELVLHSLAGDDYFENDGIFSNKIRNNMTFTAWYPLHASSSIIFGDDDKDLFLSLHKVNISISGNQTVRVSDTFDFDINDEFESEIVNSINSAGWLLQQAGVLKVISFLAVFQP